MRYLDRFYGHLREYDTTYPLPPFGESIRHIEAVERQVEDKLKDVALGEPNPELVQQTIEKFFEWASTRTTKKFNWLEVALLCRGLLVDTTKHGAIISSRIDFKAFLGRFFRLHQDSVMSAYCWQGLLNAYLNSSPRQDPAISDNWQTLRLFLHDTLEAVADQSRFKPRWLDALITHRIVLEENATQTLAEEALQGRMDRVNRIAHEVNIPPTSWFWPELLISQVKVITASAYPDEKFKPAIDHLLPQLQERKQYLDDGLARILDRYALCSIREPHPDIKTTVISRWKSPALEKQRDWERVSPEAKRMVQRWLAQEDIEDIFGKLVKDNRRYEFWLQFLDQIEYTFVWLGKEAQEYFPHLLHNRRDRCAVLKHSGKPDNNVILMKIGDIFIIESGAKAGGKCWAYRANKIIPLLNKSSLSYDIIRDPRNNLFATAWGGYDGLTHISGTWENIFTAALAKLGIKPDEMTLDEIVHRYKLQLSVLPSGTVKIGHDHSSGTLAGLLRQHQFSDLHTNGYIDGFYSNSRNSNR